MTTETSTEDVREVVATPAITLLNVIESQTDSDETNSGCCGGSCHV